MTYHLVICNSIPLKSYYDYDSSNITFFRIIIHEYKSMSGFDSKLQQIKWWVHNSLHSLRYKIPRPSAAMLYVFVKENQIWLYITKNWEIKTRLFFF